MSNHQIFFESSYKIDVGVGVPFKHLDLSSQSDCDSKREARLLLEELRKRLRSFDGLSFEMSQEMKERIIERLSR